MLGISAAMVPLTVASPASAFSPRSFSTGFDADTLIFASRQARVWFPRMEQLNATWVRIPAAWNTIAPAQRARGFRAADPGDPRYDWAYLDRAVGDAAASHEQVLLMLQSPPLWALGPGAPRSAWPGTWRPDPGAFGAFSRAVADRYSGHFPDPSHAGRALPHVDSFQAWNEPNLPTHLAPQWTRIPHGAAAASPSLYRRLLDGAYRGIKAVQPHARVLAAGLAPYGDRPGAGRMRPVQFLRELLCLHGARLRPERCPDPARFDAIDIHPYGLTPTSHALNADDVSVRDLGRLSPILRAATRTARALPDGPKPIWVTEIAWDSSPPDRLGVPIAQQASYLARAFYELWREGVDHVLWYEVRDLGTFAGNFTGAGLFFTNGRAKPSAAAFRFPFVATAGPRGTTRLWGRVPRAGVITIEVALHGSWRSLARLTAARGGVFDAVRRIAGHVTLRARVGRTASNPYPTA